MSVETTSVPGRWTNRGYFEAASMEGARWRTSLRRLTLQRGSFHILAVAEIHGMGADERWILEVKGWQWQAHGSQTQFVVTKPFRTRAGAMLEAEDIIEAAARQRG